MNIGRKIKKLRKSKGISQEEIANQVDVSQAFISSVENNKRSISIKKLQEVCNVGLKINLSEFFNKNENQKNLTEIIQNLRNKLQLLVMKKNEIDDKKIIKKSKSLNKLLREYQDKRIEK